MSGDKGVVSFSRVLEIIAVITFASTCIFFILGHLAAYLYFSSFEIPYFKYTNANTAFEFALKSTDVLLSVIGVGFVLFILFGAAAPLFRRRDGDEAKKKIQKFIFSFKFILMLLFLYIFVAVAVNSLARVISSSGLKEDISKKLYIPYEVSYNQGQNTLKCVVTIGSIGKYQVFISQTLQTILIQDSSIVSIKKLFSPVPLKELPNTKTQLENPYYSEELAIWTKKWESVCPDEKLDEFEYFDFKRNGLEILLGEGER